MFKLLARNFYIEQHSIKFIKASKQKKLLIYLASFLGIIAFFMSMLSPIFFEQEKIASSIGFDVGEILLIAGVFMISTFTFISSFGLLLSTAYLDNNISNYLVLPIKKMTFFLAKLGAILVNVLSLSYLVATPIILGYIFLGDFLLSNIIFMLIYPLLISLICLMLNAFIIGTLLYFINKIKNKALARNLLYIIILSVAISVYMLFIFKLSSSTENIIGIFSVIETIRSVLFVQNWAINFITEQDFINILFIIITAIISLLVLFYFKLVYFKGMIDLASSQGSLRKSKKKLGKSVNYSSTRWFFYREFKDLTSGSVFFNTLFSNILIVVIYLGMFYYNMYFSGNGENLTAAVKIVNEEIKLEHIILMVVALSTFISLFSFGPTTTFSRDAYQIEAITALPINKVKAFLGKVIFNALVEFITITTFVTPIFITFKINPLYYIISLLTMALISITLNFLPVIIDLTFPTLDWDNVTNLVKRGKSVIITLLVNVAHIALLGFIAYFLIFKFDVKLPIICIIAIGYYIILFFILYNIYSKAIKKAFIKIQK